MDELLEKIIYRSILKNATDVHLILRKELKVCLRIYGVLMDYDTFESEMGMKLMNFIKYRSSIHSNYRLLPQTGHFKLIIQKKLYYFRVSYLPTLEFESIVIRILNNHDILKIEQLTPQKEIQSYLYWLTQQKNGLFLISGATGSGKSTTLYTLLKEISLGGKKNIITIEDPIEVYLEDCLQVEFNDKLGITYEQTLKQILRHDPDVIMIGEIRDELTAKIAVTCALTGHLVLTTIHASSAPLSLKRLMNLNVKDIDIIDVVIGVMSQQIHYFPLNKEVIMISELLNKQQIQSYIEKGEVDYLDFCQQAQKLVDEGYTKELLKEVM